MADYSALVVDHFERPRNSGRFDPAADVIEGSAGRRTDGVHFVLTARVEGEVISGTRFLALGCPHCIAAASWLGERLVGADRSTLQQWSWREVSGVLEVPTHKSGRLLVLEDAVRAMGADWLGKQAPADLSPTCDIPT